MSRHAMAEAALERTSPTYRADYRRRIHRLIAPWLTQEARRLDVKPRELLRGWEYELGEAAEVIP